MGDQTGSLFLQQFGVQEQRKVRWDLNTLERIQACWDFVDMVTHTLGIAPAAEVCRETSRLVFKVSKLVLTDGTCCGQVSGDGRITLSRGTEESCDGVFSPIEKTTGRHGVIRDSH